MYTSTKNWEQSIGLHILYSYLEREQTIYNHVYIYKKEREEREREQAVDVYTDYPKICKKLVE